MWPTIRWKNIPRLLFPHPLTLLDMISKVRVVDDYREHYHGGDNDLVSLCLADNEEEKDSSVKIISGKREMNGYYCTLPRNLSHRYFFFKFMNLVMIFILDYFTNYLDLWINRCTLLSLPDKQ